MLTAVTTSFPVLSSLLPTLLISYLLLFFSCLPGSLPTLRLPPSIPELSSPSLVPSLAQEGFVRPLGDDGKGDASLA